MNRIKEINYKGFIYSRRTKFFASLVAVLTIVILFFGNMNIVYSYQ
jgi:hypothetical protein